MFKRLKLFRVFAGISILLMLVVVFRVGLGHGAVFYLFADVEDVKPRREQVAEQGLIAKSSDGARASEPQGGGSFSLKEGDREVVQADSKILTRKRTKYREFKSRYADKIPLYKLFPMGIRNEALMILKSGDVDRAVQLSKLIDDCKQKVLDWYRSEMRVSDQEYAVCQAMGSDPDGMVLDLLGMGVSRGHPASIAKAARFAQVNGRNVGGKTGDQLVLANLELAMRGASMDNLRYAVRLISVFPQDFYDRQAVILGKAYLNLVQDPEWGGRMPILCS